jgi:hypothetical protein
MSYVALYYAQNCTSHSNIELYNICATCDGIEGSKGRRTSQQQSMYSNSSSEDESIVRYIFKVSRMLYSVHVQNPLLTHDLSTFLPPTTYALIDSSLSSRAVCTDLLTLRGANSSSLLVRPSITCGRDIERAERERRTERSKEREKKTRF